MSHRALEGGQQWQHPSLTRKGEFAWTAPFGSRGAHVAGVRQVPLHEVLNLPSTDFFEGSVGDNLGEVVRRGRASVSELKRSIAAKGFTTPVDTYDSWHTPDGRVTALADGHHRVAAANDLGLDSIPVRELVASPDTAALGKAIHRLSDGSR